MRSRFFLPLLGLGSLFSAALQAEPFVATGLVLPFLEVTVSSPVQSHVEEHLFRQGDTVTEGAILTRLFGRIENLNMQRAKAALEKREFDSRAAENLFRDKLISEDEALEKRIELDLARLQYEIARETYEVREIRSPLSGIVVERMVEVGETVRASDPMFTIVDINQVYVQLFVEAERLRQLRPGGNVRVHFPELGILEARTGVIDFIDPRVDPASGLLRVRVLVPNPDGSIKVGVRGVAEFATPRLSAVDGLK
jgi:membrane fusion protein, multidrug efflux system